MSTKSIRREISKHVEGEVVVFQPVLVQTHQHIQLEAQPIQETNRAKPVLFNQKLLFVLKKSFDLARVQSQVQAFKAKVLDLT